MVEPNHKYNWRKTNIYCIFSKFVQSIFIYFYFFLVHLHSCIHMHSVTNLTKQAHQSCSYDHQLHAGCSRNLLGSIVYSLFVSLEGSLSSNDGSSWGVLKHRGILPLLVSPLQSHPSLTLPHYHFLSVCPLHLIYCDQSCYAPPCRIYL